MNHLKLYFLYFIRNTKWNEFHFVDVQWNHNLIFDEIRIVLVPITTAKWQSIIQISGEGLKFTFLFYITKYETHLMYENDIFAKKFMTLKNSRSKNVNVLFMYSYTENSLTILWPWLGWPWWIKKPISPRNKNFCVLLLCHKHCFENNLIVGKSKLNTWNYYMK